MAICENAEKMFILFCLMYKYTYIYMYVYVYLPQNISISNKDTDVVNDSGRGYPPVYEDPGQVLGDVHGGHVDQHLDIIRVFPRVQDADLAPVHCSQGKPANEIAVCLENNFRRYFSHLINTKSDDSTTSVRIDVCLSKLKLRNTAF